MAKIKSNKLILFILSAMILLSVAVITTNDSFADEGTATFKVKVYPWNEGNMEEVTGLEVEIYSGGTGGTNSVVGTVITDANGEGSIQVPAGEADYYIENVRNNSIGTFAGGWSVTETIAPGDTIGQSIALEPGGYNNAEGKHALFVCNSVDLYLYYGVNEGTHRVLLPGSKISVYDENKTLTQTVTMDENGCCIIYDMPAGKPFYTSIENPDTVQDWKITEDIIGEESYNTVRSWQSSVVQGYQGLYSNGYDKDGDFIEGLIKDNAYTIKAKDPIFTPGQNPKIIFNTGDIVKTAIQDESYKSNNTGSAYLPVGSYTVTQIQTSEGYTKDSVSQDYTISKPQTVTPSGLTFHSVQITGSVDITTTAPNTEVTIKDDEGNTVAVVTTDEDGNATVEDLVYGDYTAEVSKTPTYWEDNTTEQTFSIVEQDDVATVDIEQEKIPKYGVTPRLVGASWSGDTDYANGNVQDLLYGITEPTESQLGNLTVEGAHEIVNPLIGITIKKDGEKVAEYDASTFSGWAGNAIWVADEYKDGFPAGEYQVSYGCASIISDEPNEQYIEFGAIDKNHTVGLDATYNFTITDGDVNLYLPVCRYWVPCMPIVSDQFGNPVKDTVVKETGHPSKLTPDRAPDDDTNGSVLNPTRRTITTGANGQGQSYRHLSGVYNYELTSVPEGYTIKESESSKDFVVGLKPVTYGQIKGVDFTVYKTATYTVHYKDADGNEIKADKVVTDGILEDEITENAPTIDGYTAKDESKTFKFTEDGMEVTFTYDINKYNVTFVDADGNEIKTETVKWGEGATAPNPPTKEGYTFKGWDKPFDNVTGDLTVTAEMTKNTYTVTFVDADGNVIKTEKIEYGESATAPPVADVPMPTGYKFDSWDKPFDNVTGDLTVTAVKVAKDDVSYTVRYENFLGGDLANAKIVENKTFGETYEETAQAITGYTVDAESKSIKLDAYNKELVFSYVPKMDVSYTIKYVDANGVEIAPSFLRKNQMFGEEYTENAKTITGYIPRKTSDKIKLDAYDKELVFVYDAEKYTVTFEDWNGDTLKTQEVEFNKDAVPPTDPTRTGYNFTGWDVPYTGVFMDITVTAQYEPKTDVGYSVEYKNAKNEDILTPKTVGIATWGQTYTENAPTVTGYTPVKASDTITIDAFNKILTMNYTAKSDVSYTVHYVDTEGAELLVDGLRTNKTFDETYEETAPTITGYTPQKSVDSITLDAYDKEMTFVYDVNTDVNYFVKYVDANGAEIATSVERTDKTFGEEYTEDAINVTGYTAKKDSDTVVLDAYGKTLTFVYDINEYSVTFENWNGDTLKDETVFYGSGATAPTDPTREGYTFTGWDKDFDNITEDITITAQYERNEYTVTFEDEDGNELKKEQVLYGDDATAPNSPTKTGYTFKNWSEDFTNVTKDLTVTPVYDVNTDVNYFVKYVDANGAEIATSVERTDKTFGEEYTEDAVDVTGYTPRKDSDTVVLDAYGKTLTFVYDINEYSVTFKDWNGDTLKDETVTHGSGATAPTDPTREGYNFTGWDKPLDNITGDTTITAQYEPKTDVGYSVEYKNAKNEDILTPKTVGVATWGQTYTENAPTITGYTPVKASDTITIDAFNKVLTMNYTANTDVGYTIHFVDSEGSELMADALRVNKTFGEEYTENAPTITGYTPQKSTDTITLDAYDKEMTFVYDVNTDVSYKVLYQDAEGNDLLTPVTRTDKTFGEEYTENAEGIEGYTARKDSDTIVLNSYDKILTFVYDINEYSITFEDWNGDTLKDETVAYGSGATAPEDPAREGYTFTGWDKTFDNVTSDLTITAQYEKNEYTITFEDEDGNELKKEQVLYGDDATAPTAPEKEGYTFKGWDKDFTNVKEDLTVTAQYEKNEYTVVFEDENGDKLKTEQVAYGDPATAPNAPTKEGYTFTGWDKDFSDVKTDLTITAQYKKNEYSVVFKDSEGNELKTEKVEYGDPATAPTAPEKEGYTFKGWDKDFSDVKTDLTVTAQYEKNEYEVVFVDEEGKTLKTEQVAYGDPATAPTPPEKEGYTFTGWDKSFDKVTEDMKITAQYEKNPATTGSYTVKYQDENGKEIAPSKTVQNAGLGMDITETAAKVDKYTPIKNSIEFTFDEDGQVVVFEYKLIKHNVTFVDENGDPLKEEEVVDGEPATAPKDPEKEGYTFKGWDKDFTEVKDDLTISPIFEKNTFTVDFVDNEGNKIKTETVGYGDPATAPQPPKKDGYTFIGWDKDFSKVTGNLTVTAKYEKNPATTGTYKVVYQDNNGKDLAPSKSVTATLGSSLSEKAIDISKYTPLKGKVVFTFKEDGQTITFVYEKIKHEVTFVDENGNTIAKQEVVDGDPATAPKTPTKEGYTFKGWDKSFDKVTGNMVISPIFEKNKEKVEKTTTPSTPIAKVTPKKTTPKETAQIKTVRTGDDFSMLTWLIVLTLAGITILGIFARRKYD